MDKGKTPSDKPEGPKPSVEELKRKAEKPSKDAMVLHPFYKGKVQVALKAPVRTFDDFAIWYTPGVAAACKDIAADKAKSWEHTNRANTIAVVSDCTRVLGLGDIGPEAGMPVMEGKAMLFKYLGGVDTFPLCINTKDPEKIIEFVKMLEPSVGGINLEDIAQPKCFTVLDRLRRECSIPVWHDDQQGTATITLAALMNAAKLVGKKLPEMQVSMIGSGAANICIGRLFMAAGVRPGNMYFTDTKGILNPQRKDVEKEFKEKWEMAQKTNREGRAGGPAEAFRGVDAVVACSKPGPNTLDPAWIRLMAKDPIVFCCANPIPEMWPWDALENGAKVFATGRSDFPNQVNNSLGFPGIFRGTLDVMAKTITDEMCIAAADELAKLASEKGLRADYIVPTMDDWEVFPREAAAVGVKAIEQGIARRSLTRKQLYDEAMEKIRAARDHTRLMMEKGVIPKAPI
ncbi:MAG: NADP-dependent malic enzyme [Euryarchaeota archaeon]|nr:NADP-dependent malic enzyme [Euryarchaeota archaeon]